MRDNAVQSASCYSVPTAVIPTSFSAGFAQRISHVAASMSGVVGGAIPRQDRGMDVVRTPGRPLSGAAPKHCQHA